MFLLAISQWLFPLAIPLVVRNQLPVARDEIPVQMGLPFPQGKLQVSEVAKLTISDSATGMAVPAGITSTVLWHDGSVRWTRILFPATVPANGSATYMLTDANKNTSGGL